MSAILKKGRRNLKASKTVEPLVRLIVNNFRPQRIVLFGLQARGDANQDSDFDLLIIAPSDKPRWQRTVPVYKALRAVVFLRISYGGRPKKWPNGRGLDPTSFPQC